MRTIASSPCWARARGADRHNSTSASADTRLLETKRGVGACATAAVLFTVVEERVYGEDCPAVAVGNSPASLGPSRRRVKENRVRAEVDVQGPRQFIRYGSGGTDGKMDRSPSHMWRRL